MWDSQNYAENLIFVVKFTVKKTTVLSHIKTWCIISVKCAGREDIFWLIIMCRMKLLESECSGNVTRENVEKLVSIGVDYISSGALTHSSPILDLSLKNLHEV